MNEKVEFKIQELKKLQVEELEKKKRANIEAWDLTEKNENGKNVPMELSEEEYEALIEASEGVNPMGSRNSIAKLLNTLSLIALTVGIVAGIGVAAVQENLGFIYFSICAAGGFVLYAIFKGLAEAIKLLQQLIDRKTETVIQRVEVPQKSAPQAQQTHPQYQQGYMQAQPQTQYQVTYTTANPPQYVAVNPQQYAAQAFAAQAQPQVQPQPQPQFVQMPFQK